VSFVVPTSLSPSRVDAFTSCPMAFRFASIEKLPEPPSVAATKGSMVHRALEVLFTLQPHERMGEAVDASFQQAVREYAVDPEFTLLGLDVGLELRLEAQVGDLTLRGIIDRLELGPDGELIVTDYKTGRAPGLKYEQSKLGGVHFYSFLCESVLGRRPAAIRLMYLRSGETITAIPSEQSVRFITTRTTAVWKAVERACTTEDFRPKQGPLCKVCSFQQWCPAFGGDPDLAKVEAPVAFGRLAAA
jgi:putative RecB family exonuclease